MSHIGELSVPQNNLNRRIKTEPSVTHVTFSVPWEWKTTKNSINLICNHALMMAFLRKQMLIDWQDSALIDWQESALIDCKLDAWKFGQPNPFFDVT